VAHDPKDPQAVNHAILTFQPIPSIPLLQQSSFSVPYLDAYSSICFRVRARYRERWGGSDFAFGCSCGVVSGRRLRSPILPKDSVDRSSAAEGEDVVSDQNADSAIRPEPVPQSRFLGAGAARFEAPCSIRREPHP